MAEKIRKLPFIDSEVQIGNIAIKFRVKARKGTIGASEVQLVDKIDLVLRRERPEEFPRLRGGSDFQQNSARINGFLEAAPAARHAIIGLKTFLELWRWAQLQPTNWTRGAPAAMPLDTRYSFIFFMEFGRQLMDWETTSFGNDLKQDLGMLSAAQRAKYVAGLERITDLGIEGLRFRVMLKWLVRVATCMVREGRRGKDDAEIRDLVLVQVLDAVPQEIYSSVDAALLGMIHGARLETQMLALNKMLDDLQACKAPHGNAS